MPTATVIKRRRQEDDDQISIPNKKPRAATPTSTITAMVPQVSPKSDTLSAAASPAPDPGSKRQPRRRTAARRRSPRSEMLKDLPGHDFGLGERVIRRGFWSTRQENQMRRRADASLQQQQQQQQQQLGASAGFWGKEDRQAELRLWLVLDQTYGCGLGDLFRYGLRPCFRPQSITDQTAAAAAAAVSFSDYCDKLADALSHPIFRGRVDLARYALQLAVQARYYEDHPAPLRPPYSRSAPAFIGTVREWAAMRGEGPDATLRDEAAMAQWMADVHQPVDFAEFAQRLYEDREPDAVAASWNESVFFFLCASDIDALAGFLPPMPPQMIPDIHPAATYSSSFGGGRDAAAATAWLRERQVAWFRAGQREMLIRTAMNRKRQGDVLLDIPPFDPDPLWHLVDDIESKQLAALGWGDYPLEHAAILWFKGTTVVL